MSHSSKWKSKDKKFRRRSDIYSSDSDEDYQMASSSQVNAKQQLPPEVDKKTNEYPYLPTAVSAPTPAGPTASAAAVATTLVQFICYVRGPTDCSVWLSVTSGSNYYNRSSDVFQFAETSTPGVYLLSDVRCKVGQEIKAHVATKHKGKLATENNDRDYCFGSDKAHTVVLFVSDDLDTYSRWLGTCSLLNPGLRQAGWEILLGRIGRQYIDLAPDDFLKTLQELCFERQSFGLTLDPLVLLRGMHEKHGVGSNELMSGKKFMNWCVMMYFVTAKFKTPCITSIYSADMDRLAKFDVFDVAKELRSCRDELILAKCLGFIDNILRCYGADPRDLMPWAFVRCSVSCNPAVESLFRKYPRDFLDGLSVFSPFLFHEKVSSLLVLLPNLETLLKVPATVLSRKQLSNTVAPRILRDDKYKSSNSNCNIEEYGAILEFISFNSDLWETFRVHSFFQVSSAAFASLPVSDLVQQVIFRLLQLRAPWEVVEPRLQSIIDVSRQRSDDNLNHPNYTTEVLDTLRGFLTDIRTNDAFKEYYNSEQDDKIIRCLRHMLPKSESGALLSRLAAYLNESHPDLAAMERETFCDIFVTMGGQLPRFRADILWKKYAVRFEKHAKADSETYWQRLSHLLAVSWKLCLSSYCQRDDTTSVDRRVALSSLYSIDVNDRSSAISDFTVDYLCCPQIQELCHSLSDEIVKFPHLLAGCAEYVENSTRVNQTSANIISIANCLGRGDVLPDLMDWFLVEDRRIILGVLVKLGGGGTLSEEKLKSWKKHREFISTQYHDLLIALRDYMGKHPRYSEVSLQMVAETQGQIEKLQKTVVKDWKEPIIGGAGMKQIADQLQLAQRSLVFQWVFDSQIESEKDLPALDASSAASEWLASVNQCMHTWTDLVVRQIQTGRMEYKLLQGMFAPILSSMPEMPPIPNDEAKCREVMRHHMDSLSHFCTQIVEAESRTTAMCLQSDLFDTFQFQNVLLPFLKALLFIPRSKSLVELITLMECNSSGAADPMVKFSTALSDTSTSVIELNSIYDEIKSSYGTIIGIIPHFPALLVDLIHENFLDFLGLIEGVSTLRQKIERLQNSFDAEELYALRDSYTALFTAPDNLFFSFRGKTMRSTAEFCCFLMSVDWSYNNLLLLKGRVAALGSIYNETATSTSTVGLVHALVIRGEFTIIMPGAILSARTLVGSALIVLSATELGDTQCQLCLHGKTMDIEDDLDSNHQRYFLKVMELLSRLCNVLSQLQKAGHPNFQESKLTLRANPDLIEALVDENAQKLKQWQHFLRSYADINLPLLTFLSRMQLVHSIRMLECEDTDFKVSELSHLLSSIYPKLAADSANSLVRQVLNNPLISDVPRSKQLLSKVHELLSAGSVGMFTTEQKIPQRVSNQIKIFNGLIPKKIKEGAVVSVLVLPQEQEYSHVELTCALYIALNGRLPAPPEVFHCTGKTSEQEVSDFLRCWAASKYFNKFFDKSSETKPNFLFCMLNIESLKPDVQNAVLQMINAVRQNGIPGLLLLSSAPTGEVPLLCSGLRNDWVVDEKNLCVASLPLCKEYFSCVFPNICVVSSDAPNSGKSTTIVTDLVADVENMTDGDKRPAYCRFTLSGDLELVSALLTASDRDRGHLEEGRGVVVHFNVSSKFDIPKLNMFLMSYIICGVFVNSDGACNSRYNSDIIAIEWPSEGILATRALQKCGLCRAFRQHGIVQKFSCKQIVYNPVDKSRSDCVLYDVATMEDEDSVLGYQMAKHYFENRGASCCMPHVEDVRSTPLEDDVCKYAFLSMFLVETQKLVSPPLPGLVYRFAHFFVKQMYGLFHYPFYHSSTREIEELELEYGDENQEVSHSRRLAFHLATACLQLAGQLAASAVSPLADSDICEDERLAELSFSFEDWKRIPFLFFSVDKVHGTSDFRMISVSGENLVLEATKTDCTEGFQEFLRHQILCNDSSASSNVLEHICSEMNSDTGFDPVSDENFDHPYRFLLEILYEKNNFGHALFSALRAIKGKIHSGEWAMDSSILELCESHETVLSEIRSRSGNCSSLSDTETIGDFISAVDLWFKSLCGSYMDAERAPFILSFDNLIRLLAIQMRLSCKVPVIFMGETGCGKTHLVSFFGRITGRKIEIINIHGGMTPAMILEDMARIIDMSPTRDVLVLLDEINSTPHVWTIKEIVCEGFILGRRIPSNVQFICIMNPLKKRSIVASFSGLDYSPYQSNPKARDGAVKTGHTRASDDNTALVYEVNRSPEALMALVWDFGSPSGSFVGVKKAVKLNRHRTMFYSKWNAVSEEIIFAENMLNWMIKAKLSSYDDGINLREHKIDSDFRRGKLVHYEFLRSLLCALIFESQQFLRADGGVGESNASLRDIARVISLVPFIVGVQLQLANCGYSLARAKREQHLYFKFLYIAVCVSFTLNYALRLETRASDENSGQSAYFQRICKVWAGVREDHRESIHEDFLPTPETASHVYSLFDSFAEDFCDTLNPDKGFAKNSALKENVVSLFCSILGNCESGIAQFIVGRPGSTKSSSLDILCAAMSLDRDVDRIGFFKHYGFITKFSLQCTPDTTAMDIERIALRAAKAQQRYIREKKTVICIIVLEEVGVTVGSRHNPLMVLHGLVDRGVRMEDGSHVKLPIIGLSNWRLDASKMNRMRTTHRGNPSTKDLLSTATCIMGANGDPVLSAMALSKFVNAFSMYVLGNDAVDSTKSQNWSKFYGMRDFYAFVQFLQIHHSYPLTCSDLGGVYHKPTKAISPHLVKWACKINFGGHPDPALENQLSKLFFAAFYHPSVSSEIADWETGTGRRMCDICARLSHYNDVRIARPPVVNYSERRVLFGQHFQKSRQVDNCMELDSTDSFPTASVISYCLNVLQERFTSSYRVRHVLLFSRSHAGLHLLFSLNLVLREQAVILFGRNDPSTRDTLDDLIQVRRCMQNGKVLILVEASHLYESLYDALNQHYTAEGNDDNKRYYTGLTMNGFTASFPIHSAFRCIAIEELSRASTLQPPFLNRFVKAVLNYSTALKPDQVAIAREVRNACIIYTPTGAANILMLLIPGLTSDTIDSLAYTFPEDCLKTPRERHEANRIAKLRLSMLIVPRVLMHAQNGSFQLLSGADAMDTLSNWVDSARRSHDLEEDWNELKCLDVGDAAPAPHIFVLTEQICLNLRTVSKKLSRMFGGAKRVLDPIDLHLIASEKALSLKLSVLQDSKIQKGFFIALFDTNRISKNDNADKMVERFVHMVNNLDLTADKHVVLIGITQNSSLPSAEISPQFHLHFHAAWSYIFIDELDGGNTECPLSLNALLDTTRKLTIRSVLTPQVFCYFARQRALSIAQRVAFGDKVQLLADCICAFFSDATEHRDGSEYKEEESGDAKDDYASDFDVSDDDAIERARSTADPGMLAIMDRLLSQVDDVPELQNGKWRKVALKKVRYGTSLRQHLAAFFELLVERLFLKNADSLFSHGNFFHCQFRSPERNLFCILAESRILFPEQEGRSCFNVDLPVTIDTNFNTMSTTVFPFSFVLIPMLQAQGYAGEEKVSEMFWTLLGGRVFDLASNENQKHWLGQLYIKDVITNILQESGGKTPLSAGFSILLACKLSSNTAGATYSVGALHALIANEPEWVSAAIRFCRSAFVDLASLTIPSDDLSLDRILLSAARSESTGLANISLLSDIVTVCGDTSFTIDFHRAVGLAIHAGISDSPGIVKDFVTQCEASAKNLMGAFQGSAPFAIVSAKFIIPILLDHTKLEDLAETISYMLHFVSNNFDILARPASAFVFKRCFEYWLSSEKTLLLDELNGILARYGSDGEISVLLSRAVYDYCDQDERVFTAIDKCNQLEEQYKVAGEVMISGAITSGIHFLCDKSRHSYMMENGIAGVDHLEVLDDEASSVLLEKIESSLSSPSRVDGGAEFALRVLSGAIEVKYAKEVLVHRKFLPNQILAHRLNVELQHDDVEVPSPLHAVDGYSFACNTIQGFFLSKVITAQQRENLRGCNSAGVAAALLDYGFCQPCDNEQMSQILDLVSTISNDEISSFARSLLAEEYFKQLTNEMSKDHKTLLISMVLAMLSRPAGLLAFYRRDIQNGPQRVVEHAKLDIAALVTRLLQLIAGVSHFVQHPQRQLDRGQIIEHRRHIVDQILNVRCPSCNIVFDGFEGCFSITCVCGSCFCGWCFERFPDAHEHVLECPRSLHRGDYHGSVEQFFSVRRECQREKLREYLGSMSAEMSRSVLEFCWPDLLNLKPPLPSLDTTNGFSPLLGIYLIFTTINQLKALLFPASIGDSPAMLWMHSLVWCELPRMPGELNMCGSNSDALQIASALVKSSASCNAALDELRLKCKQAVDESSTVTSIITWDSAHNEKIRQMSLLERSHKMPHHYALRTRFSMSMLWTMVECQQDRFKLLHFLKNNERSLKKGNAKVLLFVLAYLKDIWEICLNMQMTRAMAMKIELGDLAHQHAVLGGERMVKFCTSFKYIFENVKRYECKDEEYLLRAFGFVKELDINLIREKDFAPIPLIYLLPRNEDEGMLMNVIYAGCSGDLSWQSPGLIQNTAARCLVDYYGSPVRDASSRAFNLILGDFVTFNEDRHLTRFLPLYTDSGPVARITEDVDCLQTQILYSETIWGKPVIAVSLPPFPFSEDYRKSIFGELLEVMGGHVAVPEGDILVTLTKFAKINPVKGNACMEFTLLLAQQIVRTPEVRIPGRLLDLTSLVQVPLTEGQRNGKACLLEIAGHLHPAHLIAIASSLWDGVCHPGCTIPLPEELETKLKTSLASMINDLQTREIIPQLIICLRVLGIQQMCTEQSPAFYEQLDMLLVRDVPGPSLDVLSLEKTVFADISIRHFAAVFECVENMVAACAELQSDQRGVEDFDVSLEAMRSTLLHPAENIWIEDNLAVPLISSPTESAPSAPKLVAARPWDTAFEEGTPPSQSCPVTAELASDAPHWEHMGALFEFDFEP